MSAEVRPHPFEGCRTDAWRVEANYGRRRFFAPPSVRCEWLSAVRRVQRRRSLPLSQWPPSLLGLCLCRPPFEGYPFGPWFERMERSELGLGESPLGYGDRSAARYWEGEGSGSRLASSVRALTCLRDGGSTLAERSCKCGRAKYFAPCSTLSERLANLRGIEQRRPSIFSWPPPLLSLTGCLIRRGCERLNVRRVRQRRSPIPTRPPLSLRRCRRCANRGLVVDRFDDEEPDAWAVDELFDALSERRLG